VGALFKDNLEFPPEEVGIKGELSTPAGGDLDIRG